MLERSFDLPNCINIYLHLVFGIVVIFKWWGIYSSIWYKMNTNFLTIFSNWLSSCSTTEELFFPLIWNLCLKELFCFLKHTWKFILILYIERALELWTVFRLLVPGWYWRGILTSFWLDFFCELIMSDHSVELLMRIWQDKEYKLWSSI